MSVCGGEILGKREYGLSSVIPFDLLNVLASVHVLSQLKNEEIVETLSFLSSGSCIICVVFHSTV